MKSIRRATFDNQRDTGQNREEGNCIKFRRHKSQKFCRFFFFFFVVWFRVELKWKKKLNFFSCMWRRTRQRRIFGVNTIKGKTEKLNETEKNFTPTQTSGWSKFEHWVDAPFLLNSKFNKHLCKIKFESLN